MAHKTFEVIKSMDGRYQTLGSLITEIVSELFTRDDDRMLFASSPNIIHVISLAARTLALESDGRSGLRTIDGQDYVSGYWVEPEKPSERDKAVVARMQQMAMSDPDDDYDDDYDDEVFT